MDIVLPKQKVKADQISPRKLIIYSKPKVGKTTLAAMLDNALILDLEKGSGFLEALKIEINSVEHLKEVCKKIKDEGKPYKYTVVDTITKLEEMCIPLAKKLYQATPMGRNFNDNILNLPNGGGYLFLRQAFFLALSWVEACSNRIIYMGHLKAIMIDKDGKEVATKDIDLTGKIKSMTAADMDGIGLLYREENKNILSFKTEEEVICGARPKHLKMQDIVLGEEVNGKLVAHWDKIYID